MSHLLPVELPKAYRLLNHGPTVLVSSAAHGQRNIMADAWAMPLDFDPPKVLVVVDRNTLTRELMEASGVFALQVPSTEQAQLTMDVGTCSGRDGDKFSQLAIASHVGSVIDVPLADGCLAYLECRIIDEPHNQQRYDLFIGEVVAARADSRAFSQGRWNFEGDAPRSLHYVAGGSFFATGEAFSVNGSADGE